MGAADPFSNDNKPYNAYGGMKPNGAKPHLRSVAMKAGQLQVFSNDMNNI